MLEGSWLVVRRVATILDKDMTRRKSSSPTYSFKPHSELPMNLQP